MNIKILEPISENLVEVTLPFGSRVYGTHGSDSDCDYIKILKKPMGELILQYQDSAVDYVYVDYKNFIYLATTGGNLPMFEATKTPDFRYWHPETLEIDVYATAKAYLGLARRDLHYPERLGHVHRGYWCALKLASVGDFNLNEIKDIDLKQYTASELWDLVAQARTGLNKQFKKI